MSFPIKNSLAELLILTLLLAGSLSEQYDAHSAYDEDITILPQLDEPDSSFNYQTRQQQQQQSNHEQPQLAGRHSADSRRQEPAGDETSIDPFRVTFEDYMKEASESFAHHIVNNQRAADPGSASKTQIPQQQQPTESSSISSGANNQQQDSITIEEEDNLIKPNIDYIFPPAAPKDAAHHHSDAGKRAKATESDAPATAELVDYPAGDQDIKLQFTWKQLAKQSKCSKSCGRGTIVTNLSCIDLKYEVRVADDLCLSANIPRPTSEEFCNEIDCPPQWNLVEYENCQFSYEDPNNCRRKKFEKYQCTMVDKRGITVYLEDSKCNQSQQQQQQPAPIAELPLTDLTSNDIRTSELVLRQQLDARPIHDKRHDMVLGKMDKLMKLERKLATLLEEVRFELEDYDYSCKMRQEGPTPAIPWIATRRPHKRLAGRQHRKSDKNEKRANRSNKDNQSAATAGRAVE